MRQEKNNKLKGFFNHISFGINRYIREVKIRVDIIGLIILFAISLFLSINFFFDFSYSKLLLFKILFGYFWIAFAYSSIIFLISIVLRKINKANKTFFDKIFKILIWVFLFVVIPMFGIIQLLNLIINHRAKKSDNLTIMLLILVIDLIILRNILDLDFSWISMVYKTVNEFTSSRFSMVIKDFPFELFLTLFFFKVVVDILNFALLFAMKRFGIYSIRKSVKSEKDLKAQKFKPEDNLKDYLDEVQEYEENQNNELEYDLLYFKKSFPRPQLLVLVLLFINVTLAPDYLFPKHQSDAINVLTIFTLVSMLIDKNREWDKDLQKVLDKISEKEKEKKKNKKEKPEIILDNTEG